MEADLFVDCNRQKDKIAYVTLDLVAVYAYIADLIIELRVGCKNAT